MSTGHEYDDFEKHVRQTLSDMTGYTCKKQREVGQSGNRWQVDCVLLDDHNRRQGYVEIKETSRTARRSTYTTHMRRAYAEMGDFRHMDAPKAVVVAEKLESKQIDWDAMLESIDCMVIDMENLDRFAEKLD